MNMMTTAQTSKTSKTTEEMIANAGYAHRQVVQSVANRYRLPDEATDDLMQDVIMYLISYHRSHGIELSSQFKSLVRSSAIQRALNMLRSRRVRVNYEQEEWEGFDPACCGELPDQHLEAEDRLERARACLPDCLHHQYDLMLDGYSRSEVHQITKCNINTYASRVKRIRRHIESELEDG